MLIISRALADRRDEAFFDDKVAWNGYEPGSLAIPTTDEVILESNVAVVDAVPAQRDGTAKNM
jgi:hypothetical protein